MAKEHEKLRKRGARRPEVLAPAGDEAALAAALSAGADSVYFGLAEGFNARARAGNFSLDNLDLTVARIHRAGARAFLAVNTLIFEGELEFVERVIRRAAESGVDALIVQDPAVALLARAICPELEVHASTQMTISSAEGAEFAASLGATRVVVPRELSVAEIRELASATKLELEVFIHGALCVAWSGQCLTSAAWSGRSANRGECAQSCRMPYDLVLDGEVRELGDVKYLLSPKDLAGLRAVEELCDIGVHGLKIEGRQKSAQYVFTATETYRHHVDAITERSADEGRARADLLRASLSYTRGFGDGFLGGSDHQTLVEGRFPKHRGVYLGRVASVGRDTLFVERDPEGRPWTGALLASERRAPLGEPKSVLHGFGGAANASDGPQAAELDLRAGMGVVFERGEPEDQHEPGGPIFRVDVGDRGWKLGFGVPGPDLSRVAIGDRVWVTSDPSIAREVEREIAADAPSGRIAIDLRVSGAIGEQLEVAARAMHATASARSDSNLVAATRGGLDATLLREKLAAFGGTPFRLRGLDLERLAEGLHLPVSELKSIRRRLVEALTPEIERGEPRVVRREGAIDDVRSATRSRAVASMPPRALDLEPKLLVLCRRPEQLEAAIEAGQGEVELDWMEMVGLAKAVERARGAGMKVAIATVRVQKPGEESYDRRIAALEPDAVLVRHWGAMVHFQKLAARPILHGDFSLNVTNSITANELFARGLDTLTASHDLDRAQLLGVLEHSDASRFTIVLHHRIATFHTEHCVYAHLLSQGRDFRTCGRPCEAHELALRDSRGREHPVIVDVGCRNTVFNDRAQSSAELAPELIARGVRRFRIELVRENFDETRAAIDAYRALLAGRAAPRDVLRRVDAANQVGVSNEPMATLGSR